MGEPPTDVHGRIFISYRREDAAYPAGWLFDRLAERFGDDHIFKDVDSIELGDDFVEVIGEAVGASDVLLALIGDRWLTLADERGNRRLDDPSDFVRIEIEAALQRKVRVIPILVEGAAMPREDQLPPSLTPLARRQALELSPARFSSDTHRLLKVIEKTLADAAPAVVTPTATVRKEPVAEAPENRERADEEAEKRERAHEEAPEKRERAHRGTRLIVLTLALVGAVLGLFANILPRGNPIGTLAGSAPETLGVPLVVAAVAVLLLVGRIREGLAAGLLVGFGTLTTAGAVSIGALSVKFDLGQSSAAITLVAAGALVFAAGLVGAVRELRAADAPGTPFRWGPAPLLAVLGAVVGVAALFVPFGTLEEDGSSASVIKLGDANGLTALALEPTVALAAALVAAYALGKGGAVRLLAAGAALALGAQTMLFFGTLVGAVASDSWDVWKPGLGAGPVVGFAAAALILAAGLAGRRPAPIHDLRPATTT
jgi:TIR domain